MNRTPILPGRRRRASFARLAALWVLIASTATLAPRSAPADAWQPAASGPSRWDVGRFDAAVVAWSAGSSTAAACEGMRAARSRTASELATAALPRRTGELAIPWLSATAPPPAEPTRLVASRWSSSSPRAPPV